MAMLSRAPGARPSHLTAALAIALVLGSCSTAPPPSGSSSQSAAPSPRGTACRDIGGPSPDPTTPWWADATFYELFVRSFADGSGDGIGDLRGLIDHLDYLNDGDSATNDDLGVTGLWLMPVAESPSYHGYDVTDYTAIERDYGTAEDFRELIAAAHERGVHVIVDLVINHTSRDHPWFQDAETPGSGHDGWYVWSDTDPGWPPAAGPNPWHPDGERFYYGVFWEGMPDLNLRNDAVTAELERIANVWLEDFGVDGFRLDAAKHLIEDGAEAQVNTPETHAWLEGFRESVHAMRPDSLVLGEVWDARAATVGYVNDGSLDLTFDFGIGPTIESAVRLGDANSLEVTQAELQERYPPRTVAPFLSNHDQPRVMTDLRGDVAAAKQAAAILLTSPGSPFIYYGEELGMTGTKPDEQIRTPFPWSADGPGFGFTTRTPWEPVGTGAETANVATEGSDDASLLSTYRDLIRLRAEHPTLINGTYIRLTASTPGVSAVLRASDDETLMIVHNLTADDASDVSISDEDDGLCGQPSGALVYASVSGLSPAGPPTVNARGGLQPWTPVPVLPAHSTLVFDLSP